MDDQQKTHFKNSSNTNVGHQCKSCREQPAFKNCVLGQASIHSKILRLDHDELNASKVIESCGMDKNKDLLISIGIPKGALTSMTGKRIWKFFEELAAKKIRFKVSKPLPRCMFSFTEYEQVLHRFNIPKNCFECHELFGMEGDRFRLCPTVYNMEGPQIGYAKNREHLCEILNKKKEEMPTLDACKQCMHFMRKHCDGLEFRTVVKKEKKLCKSTAGTPELKKSSSCLKRFPQLCDTAKYLLTKQNEDGSYPTLCPDPVNSVYFLGILKEMDSKPNNETIKWVRSLQTGKRGFGETTGENSWDYTTFWGSKMHEYLGLEPKSKEDYARFIQAHQNTDGGFGATINSGSDLEPTLNWSLSLLNLGFEVKDKEKLHRYILAQFRKTSGLEVRQLYQMLLTVQKLGFVLDSNVKGVARTRLELARQKSRMDAETEYEYRWVRSVLGHGPNPEHVSSQNFSDIPLDEPACAQDPSTVYYYIKLVKTASRQKTAEIKEKILSFVKSNELQGGGFVNRTARNTHTAYSCVSALDLLGYVPRYAKELILWLKMCQNQDGGFGYCPNSVSSEKAAYWTTEMLSTLNALDSIDTCALARFLESRINFVSPFMSYYLLGTYARLGLMPKNYAGILAQLIQYKTHEGGFAQSKNCQPQMYETFRAVHAIYFVENFLNARNIEHPLWLSSMRKDVVGWLLRCEAENGGFSWVPGDIPYIQPTYHAIEILNIFKQKIGEKHTKWILQFQNKDGGFNGGEIGTPADAHFTFWAIKSLAVISANSNNRG